MNFKRCTVSFYPFLFLSVWHGEKKRNLVSTKRPKHESRVVQTSEHKNGKKIILIYWQCRAFSSRFTCMYVWKQQWQKGAFLLDLMGYMGGLNFLYETPLCWKKTLHKGNRKSIKTREGSRLATRFPYCGFFIVFLVFHTPSFYILCFTLSWFSTLHVSSILPSLSTLRFPHSSCATLNVFRAPRFPHSALLINFNNITLLLKQCL